MAKSKTNNAANVTAGKPKATGAIFAAPLKTALPQDAAAALDEAFVCFGYISEDGVENEVEENAEAIKAWGGDTVLSTITERSETFKFTAIEAMNQVVLEQVYGAANVSEQAGALTIKHMMVERPKQVFVIELAFTGGRTKRIVIPNGQITEVGGTTYEDGEPVGYELTVSAYPDTSGVSVYEYLSAEKA